jgi:tetratricopeptide (TPR) repeat protein
MKTRLALGLALVSLLAALVLPPFLQGGVGGVAAAGEALATLPACPISLTNPDGQALDLERYDLRVAVHGPLALVEMEMVFRNPLNKQMEGRFLYLLPPGATVSRFAKEVNGKLMEGEVVEKLRAQRVYTEILHTLRDPALLEQDQGNRFSARVFPIAANGAVRLVLSYSQVVPLQANTRKIAVPLAGLPKIGEFSATLVFQDLPESSLNRCGFFGKIEKTDTQPQVVSRTVKDFQPQEDFEAVFAGLKDPQHATVVRAGSYQLTAYRPELPENNAAPATDWAFYFDTSASGADMEARRLEATEKLLVALVPVLREKDKFFSAWAFDLDAARLMDPVSMNSDGGKPLMPRVTAALRARHCLGATNLEAALKHLGEQARAAKQPTRFVLVSDGIATLGAREPRELVAALGDWPAQHVLHALVIGPKQDEKTLNAIVEKTRGRVVTLALGANLDQDVRKALAELTTPVGASFEFYDEGAAWIYPKSFRDVRPGSELIVFSQIKEPFGGIPILAKPGAIQRGADGKVVKDVALDKVAPSEVPAFAPLLRREAHAAYLNHLEKLEQAEKDAAKIAELRKQRLEVSVKNRVLCPLTSLLVLETEDDYARFGIERTALADILIVGKTGIELKHRAAEDLALRPSPPRRVRRLAQKAAEARPAGAGARAEPTGTTAALPAKDDALAAGKDETGAVEELEKELADAPVSQRQRELAHRDGATRGAAEALRAGEGGGGQGGGPAAPAAEAPREHAATAAPFAPPPPATTAPEPNRPAPQPAAGEPAARLPATNDARADAPAQAQAARPEWTKQYGALPKEDELSALRAKVAAAPLDRRLRNACADALAKSQAWDNLQALAFEWVPFDSENPQVYEFLGKSATGLKDDKTALRAFTSIAEIAPNRAALLARAGWLLIVAQKHEMAAQLFREALKNRQDDPNLYRGLSLALWLKGDHDGAAKALEDGLKQDFHDRYGDVKRVLREELGYVFRAWLKKVQAQADDTHPRVQKRAEEDGVKLDRADALRVTLAWETDANDVDLHVVDPQGEECFYSHARNASGLELYSDQTQGLGPEVIRCAKPLPGVYHVGVNYFAAGPMGVSRGVVVVYQPDKDGNVQQPVIVPFCLVEGGADMRHLWAVKF